MRPSLITRWYDGRFRARASWEPELRNILADDVARRGISWQEKVGILEDEGAREWGDDTAVVLDVCRAMAQEDDSDLPVPN
jgi:hypothetical protein